VNGNATLFGRSSTGKGSPPPQQLVTGMADQVVKDEAALIALGAKIGQPIGAQIKEQIVAALNEALGQAAATQAAAVANTIATVAGTIAGPA